MRNKLFLLMAAVLMSIGAKAGTKEVYTSFKESKETLTYYYDDKRETREAAGEITEIYDPVNDPDALRYKGYGNKIKKAKIDASMKDAHLTSMRKMFYFGELDRTVYATPRYEYMASIEGMENLVTDEVTDMSYMFGNCTALESIDLSHFNTSSVTNMEGMFLYCKSLSSLDFSHFNTSNVTKMNSMFSYCVSLTSLDLSSFNTSNVTNMNSMFNYCSKLSSLNLSSFNTSNVTTMRKMFYLCDALMSLDLSSFNTEKVIDMGEMFMLCDHLIFLDLSMFNLANLTIAEYMFNACKRLATIFCNEDLSQSENLVKSEWMFKNCTSLSGGNGTVCNGLNHIDKTYARPDGAGGKGYFSSKTKRKEVYTSFKDGTLTYYYDDQRLLRALDGETTEPYTPYTPTARFRRYNDKVKKAKIDVSMKDTLLTTTRSMFYGSVGEEGMLLNMTEIQGMENLVTDEVTDMSLMFCGCQSLASLNLKNFKTANVTDMSQMFEECEKLKSLDLSSFNTANVTNMSSMFFQCYALKSLDLRSFNTANVTNMHGMFSCCNSLKSLDLRSFNTSKVTNMSSMFYDCNSLQSVNLSTFNTENVKDFWRMFLDCTSLKSLDLSHFNIANATDIHEMFCRCSSLTTIYCNDDWSKIPTLEKSKGMFYGCTKIKGIQGTTYLEDKYDVTYARPDGGSGRPGYFTNTAEIYTSFEVPTGVMTYYYDDLRTRRKDICELYTPEKGNDLVRFEGYADQVKRVIIDESFKAAPVTSLANMFDGGSDNTRLTALETIDGLENINFSEVTSMYRMFKGCSSLKSIDLTPLHEAGQVQDLSFMFEDCSSLLHLDLSALSTANVTTMYSLCAGCSSLRNAVLYAFSTANVTDMGSMFLNCSSLTSLDMRSFDTEKVEWMPGMFSG